MAKVNANKTELDRFKQTKLDSKDRAILYELSVDSSQQATEIAKNTGLSKQVVGYRLKELIKKKIIRQTTCFVNLGVLGYELYDVLIRYRAIPDEEKFLRNLNETEKVISIIRCDGKYDLKIRMWAKNASELNKNLEEIDNNHKGTIGQKEILFIEEINNYTHKYLVNRPRKEITQTKILEENSQKERIDNTDSLILSTIVQNSRTSLRELAKKTKLSSNAVSNRLETLKKKGIIARNNIIFNDKRLKTEKRLLLIKTNNTTQERKTSLSKYISKHPNIVESEKYAGHWDVGLTIISEEDLRETTIEIRSLFSDLIDDHRSIKLKGPEEENRLTLNKMKILKFTIP